jgi:hypothetical protein
MISIIAKRSTPKRSVAFVQKRLTKLREELEDLTDYMDLLEARARNIGKPRYTTAEVRKQLGLD